jgi:prepilin-type N-terminal cleavage/methylation domain-containing protein
MKKGFTMIELLLVVAIIAILGAILVPFFANKSNYTSSSSGNNYRVEWINGHKYYQKAFEIDATPSHAGDCPLCYKSNE